MAIPLFDRPSEIRSGRLDFISNWFSDVYSEIWCMVILPVATCVVYLTVTITIQSYGKNQ